MKTIELKLEPCCVAMEEAIVSISAITDSLETKGVRFGIRISREQIWIKYCPWCGKVINLEVKGGLI